MKTINRDNIFWSKLFIIIFPIFVFVVLFYFVDSVNSIVIGANSDYNENSFEITESNYQSPVVRRSIFVSQNIEYPIVRNFDVGNFNVNASSAIAIHKDSGQILYSKNAQTVRPIASITKLMTAILATEKLNMDAYVVVSRRARFITGKKVVLDVGTTITARDALHGLLIESGNDMSIAIEEYYNAVFPQSSMVDDMNKKAQQLGLYNTKFVDSVGLSSSNTSNAYEVAKLLKYASENEIIRDIIGKQEYIYKDRVWKNTNKLIGNKTGIIGGKTGYTAEAGNAISLLGKVGQQEVLLVMLNISTNRINESSEFFDWIRFAYKW